MNLLQVEKISKNFGGLQALRSVEMEVKKGSITALIGPNGAGKTTTIRMITGLLSPTSGGAYVLGHDMSNEASSARAQIGYMSQKFSLFADLTVEENINFYGGLYGLSAAQLKAGKKWVLDMAGELTNMVAGNLFSLLDKTNGTLLSPEIVKRMTLSGIQRASISLDGARAEDHDRLRNVPGFGMNCPASLVHSKVFLRAWTFSTMTRIRSSSGLSLSHARLAVGWLTFFG
jgi:ABC-type glutathione transport system ATPase component